MIRICAKITSAFILLKYLDFAEILAYMAF